MLRPTKHSDPSRTVLAASAVILDHIVRHRTETFSQLRATLRNKNDRLDPLFLPAVSLLFTLGQLEYRVKTDSFEYVGGR